MRTLAVGVAIIGCVCALLRYSNEASAMLAVSLSALFALTAAALAIGTRSPPQRLFLIGFLVVSLGARYLESEGQGLFVGLPSASELVSNALDDYILPNTIAVVGKPNDKDYWLSESGRSVRFIYRDSDGRISSEGTISPSSAQIKGVNTATLKRWSNPDNVSFTTLIRELLITLVGVAGGLLAYSASRQNSDVTGG